MEKFTDNQTDNRWTDLFFFKQTVLKANRKVQVMLRLTDWLKKITLFFIKTNISHIFICVFVWRYVNDFDKLQFCVLCVRNHNFSFSEIGIFW